MNEKPDIFARTKRFALRIVEIVSSLPKTTVGQILGRQLLRSGTSVGAHIREGKRSRSDAEMISKIETALQELEETSYWLELIRDSRVTKDDPYSDLMQEANELMAILVTSVKTIKKRRQR